MTNQCSAGQSFSQKPEQTSLLSSRAEGRGAPLIAVCISAGKTEINVSVVVRTDMFESVLSAVRLLWRVSLAPQTSDRRNVSDFMSASRPSHYPRDNYTQTISSHYLQPSQVQWVWPLWNNITDKRSWLIILIICATDMNDTSNHSACVVTYLSGQTLRVISWDQNITETWELTFW